MKCAKVIATCFLPKKRVEKTYLLGNPVGFYGHSQKSDNHYDQINNLNFTIKLEKDCDPGVDTDLLIINNDVYNEYGNAYLKKISGTILKRGKIFCLNRENIGRSFGAYNYAFETFGNRYDYYLFTEDDILICKENYMKIGIDIFNSDPLNGYIAYIGKTKVGKWRWKELNLNKKNAFTCHGATGLTSFEILNKVYKKHNSLPYSKSLNRENDITFGEVGFPNSIIQLGYNLIDLPRDMVLSEPVYDRIRGIEYRKYPYFYEKSIYYFKLFVHNIFSKNKYLYKMYLKILKIFK